MSGVRANIVQSAGDAMIRTGDLVTQIWPKAPPQLQRAEAGRPKLMHRQQQQRAYGVDYLGTILDESFGEEFL